MQLLRSTLVACLAASATAQFGRNRAEHNAAGSLGDMGADMPDFDGTNNINDVDLAMAGWEQLGKNPEKMQELMASFKDPDVWAKAQEMLKDPQYMAAAQAKVAQLQAKAQENGLLDANGNPVPGAASASAGGLDGMMAAMQGMKGAGAAAGAGAGMQGRDWEMENVERHKAGEMNTAELGMANLKNAMKDPSVMGEIAQMMKDPENMAALKKMMADPSFQQQAQRVASQMKASGDLPDFNSPEVQARMQDAMAKMQAGGLGGMLNQMGGAGGAADPAAELARLRRENAALKAGRMG